MFHKLETNLLRRRSERADRSLGIGHVPHSRILIILIVHGTKRMVVIEHSLLSLDTVVLYHRSRHTDPVALAYPIIHLLPGIMLIALVVIAQHKYVRMAIQGIVR